MLSYGYDNHSPIFRVVLRCGEGFHCSQKRIYTCACLVTYCLSSLNGIPYRRQFWYLIKHANVIDNQSFPALPLVHIAIHTWQSVPQYMLFMTYQHAVSLCMRVCFPSFNDISALRHDLGPYSIRGWESSLPMREGVKTYNVFCQRWSMVWSKNKLFLLLTL